MDNAQTLFHGWLGDLIVASLGAILVLWIWRSVRGRAAGA
jgi:uncharacterized membrane protein YeaQ/YmgE (transglycosylase-associated protein family)